jgi:(p)ppGpp synthase/HD superfamily hydrolase
MPVPDRERAEHMARRLTRTARKGGVDPVELLARAHEVAMEPRHLRLDDDHDPRYLHPGRTALVAMGDAGLRDPVALAAAVLTETLSPELSTGRDAVARVGEADLERAWAVRDQVPSPFAEDLAERLILADASLRVVALAEWLDQLRHLRSWADADTISAAQRVTEEVYLPVAGRTHPTLARRFGWWIRRVSPGLSASS